MRSADRAVAATHIVDWAVLVAAPANSLWVLRMQWKFRRLDLFLYNHANLFNA